MKVTREADFEAYLQSALDSGHNQFCLWALRPGEEAPSGTRVTPVGGVGVPLSLAWKFEGDNDASGVQDGANGKTS